MIAKSRHRSIIFSVVFARLLLKDLQRDHKNLLQIRKRGLNNDFELKEPRTAI